MFGKLRLIKRDVLRFCSIMLLRLALAISVAKNNTCMMQSLFSWTLLNMILKKNLFFEHILSFSRDTSDFKLVFEQKTNWHFKNPASATKYFFPLLFFIYIDQNTWAQSSSTHTCIWKSESKEWTEDSRDSNYFYSKEADSFDRCNVTVSEKCYICLTILNGFLH